MFEEPGFPQSVISENRSEESPERRMEKAHEFGEQYVSILDVAIGKKPAGSLSLMPLAKENQILLDAMRTFQEEQRKLQEEQKLDARGLLRQAFPDAEQQRLLEGNGKFRLEELSPGLYAVMINPDLFVELMGGAQAVAVKIRNGVSFIIVPEFEAHSDFQKNMDENIPHETHHLIWDAAIVSGAFQSSESDADFRKGFMMFQDELIARASSNGGLGGYSHITLLSPQAREDLERVSPGKSEAILERVGGLNRFLEKLNTIIMERDGVAKKDLLQVIVTSKTFDELEDGLQKMKLLIEKLPHKEFAQPEKGGGFDSMIT